MFKSIPQQERKRKLHLSCKKQWLKAQLTTEELRALETQVVGPEEHQQVLLRYKHQKICVHFYSKHESIFLVSQILEPSFITTTEKSPNCPESLTCPGCLRRMVLKWVTLNCPQQTLSFSTFLGLGGTFRKMSLL